MLEDAEALVQQAYVKRRDGDTDGALDAYTTALSQYELAGDTEGRAHCLRHIGDILRQNHRAAEAQAYLRAAESLYRTELDDPLGLANTLRPLALLHHGAFDALPLWREAREIYRQLGIEDGVAEADLHLG